MHSACVTRVMKEFHEKTILILHLASDTSYYLLDTIG